MNGAHRWINKSLMALLAMAVTLCGLSATALAGHLHDLDVTFNELEVTQRGQRVAIEYTIRPNSWRDLERAGIAPRLNIYSRTKRHNHYRYRYSAPLDRRRGRILLDRREVRLRHGRTLELEVVGYNGPARVVSMSYGRDCAPKVRVAMRGRRADRPPRGGWQAQIIRACRAETRHGHELDKCVERAQRLPVAQAHQIIKVCGDATDYSHGLNTCLEEARSVSVDPAATIAACDEATSRDHEALKCVRKAARFRRADAPRVVRACGRHTRYSHELNKCIDDARNLRGRRVAIINACGESTRHSHDMRRCMRTADNGRSRRAQQVAHR